MSKLRHFNSRSIDDFAIDFDLKSKIGEGAFSEVWLCIQRDNEKEYAAKILKKNYGKTMDEDAWNDISEVNILKSILPHPFLLMMDMCYHETGLGRVILISELMKKSLYDVIEAGECPLSDFRIKTYIYQMLEGLKYMHENGFIHRDIKPENILLKSRDKLLKIGDFGTACHVTAGYPFTEYVATRWYRSPECLLTRGWYSTKLDIWAAGCVLFEMATGRPLFDGQDENDQMEKIDRVLGRPDARLLGKFKKHSSDVFDKRYNKCSAVAVPGVGFQTVYPPFRSAFELMKAMIVYDPVKRYSADRLLRMPYFWEMKNTVYDYKMRKFQETVIRNRQTDNNNYIPEQEKSNPAKQIHTPMNNKQEAGGDRAQQIHPQTKVKGYCEKIEQDLFVQQYNNNQYQEVKMPSSDRNRKQIPNTNKSYSKANTKNSFLSKKQSTVSVPTPNTVVVIKMNLKSNQINRPPFK
ncbi:Protein kinase domain,Protein kinase-like domain,Protein kinase, ATP binding site,Serine/threonine- [Cinara cedri]|uniref:Protein kinase domain,Protein kinase-like domain,Protein kinase, ATP binding site,Serine/threonine n=1 Tax=Cinara cedri TaxID=506608 RepID=A0A5E4NF61_9HEMI|nr:Protein kinase domain,Protein kinase-like domain,Protein kinase, ATP binding site,Serine/threonine- [Cinara cedri]